MKKILSAAAAAALCLCLSFCLFFAACADGETEDIPGETEQNDPGAPDEGTGEEENGETPEDIPETPDDGEDGDGEDGGETSADIPEAPDENTDDDETDGETDWDILYPGYITVSTADELTAVASGNSSAREASYVITDDIYLEGEWTTAKNFKGVMDGAGHTVYGLTVTEGRCEEDGDDLDYYIGFFGEMSGTVRNLSFEDMSVSVTDETLLMDIEEEEYGGDLTVHAGLAAINKGTMENVSVDIKIDIDIQGTEARVRAGGICGKNNDTLFRCSSTGEINAVNYSGYIRAGGLAGYMSKAGLIEACVSSATVYAELISGGAGKMNLGGLIGNLECGKVTRCVAYGVVTAANYAGDDDVYAGGLIGCADNSDDADYELTIEITSCYAAGSVVLSEKKSYAGGFMGRLKSVTSYDRTVAVTGCASLSADVYGNKSSAGFIADVSIKDGKDGAAVEETVFFSGNSYLFYDEGDGISPLCASLAEEIVIPDDLLS